MVGKNKKGGKGGRGARSGHLIEELKRMLPKPLAKENVNLTNEEDSQGKPDNTSTLAITMGFDVSSYHIL